MLESEAFAIAARLHVVMRRSLGRVTDVEWMIRNREYALEVIRVAREQANPELQDLAAKFEAAVAPPSRAKSANRPPAFVPPPIIDPGTPSVLADDSQPSTDPSVPRYVGRLR